MSMEILRSTIAWARDGEESSTCSLILCLLIIIGFFISLLVVIATTRERETEKNIAALQICHHNNISFYSYCWVRTLLKRMTKLNFMLNSCCRLFKVAVERQQSFIFLLFPLSLSVGNECAHFAHQFTASIFRQRGGEVVSVVCSVPALKCESKVNTTL